MLFKNPSSDKRPQQPRIEPASLGSAALFRSHFQLLLPVWQTSALRGAVEQLLWVLLLQRQPLHAIHTADDRWSKARQPHKQQANGETGCLTTKTGSKHIWFVTHTHRRLPQELPTALTAADKFLSQTPPHEKKKKSEREGEDHRMPSLCNGHLRTKFLLCTCIHATLTGRLWWSSN